MKITQVLQFQNDEYGTSSSSWWQWGHGTRFDPSDFTGIQKIYFEVVGKANNAGGSGRVALYDVDTGQNITGSELTINQTSFTRVRSGDLSSVLSSAKTFLVNMIFDQGTGGITILAAKLIVQQDTNEANKKTMTLFPCISYYTWSLGSWTGHTVRGRVKPKIGSFDGTVVCKFGTFLYSLYGPTAYIRLYDLTAGAPVDGSELSTNSTSPVWLESGPITLVDGHIYYIQMKSASMFQDALAYSPCIRIYASGFTKIAAIVGATGEDHNVSGGGYVYQDGDTLFEPAYISAGTSLSYVIQQVLAVGQSGSWAFNHRAYNKTADAAIAGTTHAQSGSSQLGTVVEDAVTMPSVESSIVLQSDFTSSDDYLGPGLIVALMEEALPSGLSLPANPMQPSGYHCFMNQFLRNVLAGLVPLKTPDGVNKCW
jgi:hypothetical protein